MPIPNRAQALTKLLEGISLKRFMELNEVWSQTYKLLRKGVNAAKRDEFSPGMVVKFRARQGYQVHAVIERVMKTRAACQEIDDTGRRLPGRTWRVSLTMLEKSERDVLR